MIRGEESLATIKQIAWDTRRDFEHGKVSDDEIIEAAIAFRALFYISKRIGYDTQTTDGLRKVEAPPFSPYYVSTPLVNLDPSSGRKVFPEGHCVIAASVLASRIEKVDKGETDIIIGGCGEDKDAMDPCSYYHNPHTFVGLGRTQLGYDTIADITGDQFPEIGTPVYVGPLADPWTREPQFEFDNV